MTTVFKQRQQEATALINPQDTVKPVAGMPKLCVTTFSKAIIDKFASLDGACQIAELYTANGVNPVYKMNFAGTEIAFYLSLVGAPACVSVFEEIIAMGAEKLVAFGSCGILDDSVGDRIIVPVSAIRDEGTSYHYLPAADEIKADETSVSKLISCLEQCGYAYVTGMSWTTDGIYRETPRRIKERKTQGCIAVEMEYAAMLAASQFRRIPFAQFLYGADCLDNDTWEIRDLNDHGLTKAEKLMNLAMRCVTIL